MEYIIMIIIIIMFVALAPVYLHCGSLQKGKLFKKGKLFFFYPGKTLLLFIQVNLFFFYPGKTFNFPSLILEKGCLNNGDEYNDKSPLIRI